MLAAFSRVSETAAIFAQCGKRRSCAAASWNAKQGQMQMHHRAATGAAMKGRALFSRRKGRSFRLLDAHNVLYTIGTRRKGRAKSCRSHEMIGSRALLDFRQRLRISFALRLH